MHTHLSSLFDYNDMAQLLNVAIAICMFVAISGGRLDQHIKTRHGHPIWSKAVGIFEKVGATLPDVYGCTNAKSRLNLQF